jgi:hypothetical protein
MHPAENTDTRTDAAACRLRKLLNEGMLALVAGLGSRDGWLDALVAAQPATAPEIARAAGADEERVRPWLATLVAGGLVDYDGARDTYALQSAVASFFTRAEGLAYRRGLEDLLALAGGTSGAHETAVPHEDLAALGADLLELDEIAVTDPAAPARIAAALPAGGLAVLAVPALSGSPSDDALHPLGAFLLGGRVLSPPPANDAGAQALGARLAAAGLVVRGLTRVPSDPFRNYLIARKPDSQNR